MALLCVLQRLKANRPLGHARQAQAAISLIAKSTRTAALPGSAPGWIRRTAWPGAGHQHAQQHQHGPSSPATPGCAQPWPAAPGSALSWIERTAARTRPMAGQRHAQHAPGQGLATRTRQARSSLAGQGVALGWWGFACWGVCGISQTQKTRRKGRAGESGRGRKRVTCSASASVVTLGAWSAAQTPRCRLASALPHQNF